MVQRNRIFSASLLCAFSVWVISCTGSADVQSDSQTSPYFGLEAYFNSEATRLQERAPTVTKTVSKNGETETHDVRIGNWQNELALFIESDINKPAWQHSYQVDSTASLLTYTAIDPDLRTEQITVEKDTNGHIKRIRIVNKVQNMLYQTGEQLDYYPDSLYRIIRKQRVQIIGESNYAVSAFIR
ncbi:hypothetical protein JHJ32_18455 [Parapedobacter sp. ISTM3]|uniref:Uncharacterized protein n=1 Tax=Parapedobacter luteus TaxID=623280 RepID=A0A1T5ARJ8_9SPHI|nr:MULTISPECIES: hypothetical protein [Parapedobacter]MBK1441986.1 hypothetical protein [Parapedobacter sp. ISTM3]SKB37450.1 hypothetical protein SAMN05660226_01003 [Parapedobacter luteus]